MRVYNILPCECDRAYDTRLRFAGRLHNIPSGGGVVLDEDAVPLPLPLPLLGARRFGARFIKGRKDEDEEEEEEALCVVE